MSSFNFGNVPATTSGFTFGSPKPAAPTMTATNFNTSQTGPGANVTSTTTGTAGSTFGFGIGTVAPPATSATLNFGGTTIPPANTMATSIAAQNFGLSSSNFSFSKMNPTTTSASLSFGTTTTTLGTGVGLFGKSLTTGGVTSTTTSIPFVGLGGVDVTSTQPKAGNFVQDNVKIRETQVPDEIAKTVDSLKSYIKAQKAISSDIGRTSTSKLNNVTNGILKLQDSLHEIANGIESNCNQIKLLRQETSKVIQTVEMAQRTQDTPVALQFENNTPFQFFQDLIAKYEQDLLNFREQIALIERHMQSVTNPENISPEDLKRALRQINESFISLAGRLHELHQKVEEQKEQYLNFRKYRLRDNSDVFAALKNEGIDSNMRISAGPTPFSSINAICNFSKSFNNNESPTTTKTADTQT